MSIYKKFTNFLISRFDHFVIKYLTVERGRNRRKFIWQTKNFREITQLHFPRAIFIAFVCVMCWKIHNKVKINKDKIPYKSKSNRQEKIEKEEKEIEYFLSIPNEFDPNKKNDAISVELKDEMTYEFHQLDEEELKKLEEFDDWIRQNSKRM